MVEHRVSKSGQGRVAVLTVLFGLLLNFAGSGAQLRVDGRAAHLDSREIVRTAGLRIAARSDDDRADPDQATLPPQPRIVTALSSLRPAAIAAPAAARPAFVSTPRRYNARAPPAA